MSSRGIIKYDIGDYVVAHSCGRIQQITDIDVIPFPSATYYLYMLDEHDGWHPWEHVRPYWELLSK